MKIYCNTNQIPELSFFGSHSKHHGARGSIRQYHFFNSKLVMGVCLVHSITCACVACKSMLDKPWISGIQQDAQERYKPVTKCTYWLVLGSLNNCKISKLSQKSTPSGTFDEIHQVVLDVISDNMESLV